MKRPHRRQCRCIAGISERTSPIHITPIERPKIGLRRGIRVATRSALDIIGLMLSQSRFKGKYCRLLAKKPDLRPDTQVLAIELRHGGAELRAFGSTGAASPLRKFLLGSRHESHPLRMANSSVAEQPGFRA
jgi:hypothetical protein